MTGAFAYAMGALAQKASGSGSGGGAGGEAANDEFAEGMEFVKKQGVERSANEDFKAETVAQSLDDVPESIRNYEPGDAYGNFVDDKGHHLWNQRLPGGYHLTVDEVNGPVNLHYDAHDPLQGPIVNFKHWYHEVQPINDGKIIVPETPSNIHRDWGR